MGEITVSYSLKKDARFVQLLSFSSAPLKFALQLVIFYFLFLIYKKD